jgi:hypothetical protein
MEVVKKVVIGAGVIFLLLKVLNKRKVSLSITGLDDESAKPKRTPKILFDVKSRQERQSVTIRIPATSANMGPGEQ